MNRARQTTLIALALIVVAFVSTWLTVPTKRDQKVNPPASWFAVGGIAGYTRLPDGRRAHRDVDVAVLKRRVQFFYGGAAAVVIFVGLAFGAARASRPS